MKEFKIAHAYLIYGADNDSLLKKSQQLIIDIILDISPESLTENLKRRIKNQTFTDIMYIEAEGSSVKVDAVRKIKTFLALVPNEGKLKFVVVCDSHLFTDVAQNAMLKLLEETPEDRFVILLAQNSDKLLPTVLSRLYKIKCVSNELELSDDVTDDLIKQLCNMLLEGSLEKIFDICSIIASDKQQISEILKKMCAFLKDMYYSKLSEETLISNDYTYFLKNVSARCINKMLRIIEDTIANIKTNGSVELSVEAMLISMREEFNAENSRG